MGFLNWYQPGLLILASLLILWCSYCVFYFELENEVKGLVRRDPLQDAAPAYPPHSIYNYDCSNELCEGSLYLPTKNVSNPVVVVMAPDTGLQKDFGLIPFIKSLQDEGYAVFAFDFRGFGRSSGAVRNLVNPHMHANDYLSTIDFVLNRLSGVSHDKVWVWGIGMSGGAALVAANEYENKNIAGVISHVPVLAAIDQSLNHGRIWTSSFWCSYFKALIDVTRGFFSQPRVYIPLYGENGFIPDSPDYSSVVPANPNGGWKNVVPASAWIWNFYSTPVYSTPQLNYPILFTSSENDKYSPPIIPKNVATQIQEYAKPENYNHPRAFAKAVNLKADGHFGVYKGEALAALLKAQTDFMKSH